MLDPLMLTKDVSEEFSIPEATLRYWRHRNVGPSSFKVRRRVMYRRSDVIAWIDRQESETQRGDGVRVSQH